MCFNPLSAPSLPKPATSIFRKEVQDHQLPPINFDGNIFLLHPVPHSIAAKVHEGCRLDKGFALSRIERILVGITPR